MAAPDYSRPRGQSSPGSPGVSGAIRDAVSAVADAVAPRPIRNRKANVDSSVDDATIGRMREGQSTDSNNDYSY